MTPDEAENLFWAEMRKHDWHETSGQRLNQEQLRVKVWEAVLQQIEAPLRQRIADLEELVAMNAEVAAQPHMRTGQPSTPTPGA